MRKAYLFILIIVWFGSVDPCFAQNHHGHTEEPAAHTFRPHTLMLFVGYTIVPKSNLFIENQTIIVPTIGLDYIYKFNHSIGIGLLNDLQLASYQIALKHAEGLKREYAFITSLVFMYEPFRWWSVFAGPGYEFEHHENFLVGKIGTEFIKPFDHGWAVALSFSVDIKEINTTPSMGISVSKGLGKPK